MTDTIDLEALTAAILNAWGRRVSDLIFVRQAGGIKLGPSDR